MAMLEHGAHGGTAVCYREHAGYVGTWNRPEAGGYMIIVIVLRGHLGFRYIYIYIYIYRYRYSGAMNARVGIN
jgi:hypothetical protein